MTVLGQDMLTVKALINTLLESHAAKTSLLRSLSLSYRKKYCRAGPRQSFFWFDINYRFETLDQSWAQSMNVCIHHGFF